MSLETIKQRDRFDCMVCCVAMAIGRPYEDVLEAGLDTGAYDPEIGTGGIDVLLAHLGFTARTLNKHTEGDYSLRHKPAALDAGYWREFAWGRRAIFCVPSRNHAVGSHAIYWDGERLHDPSNGKTYTHWVDVLPDEIILFRETFSPAVRLAA